MKSISEDPYFAEVVSVKCKAISSDENAGTATVDGVAEKNEYFGTEVTFVATPKSGYSFVEWKRGEAVVSTDATYKYTPSQTTAEDEKIELTATFKAINDYQSVSVTDQIEMNLFLDLDNRNVDVNDVTITVGGSPVTVTGTKVIEGNYKDLYQYTIVMAPAETATVIGVVIGGETILSTSVQSYCDQLAKTPEYVNETKLLALTNAILDYGTVAQQYFANEQTDTVTSDAASWTSKFSDEKHIVSGVTFMALTKPEFRFYTSSIIEAQAAAYNKAGVSAAYESNGIKESLTARFVKSEDGRILIEVKGISAENMNEKVIITVNGLGKITFSGNDFAKAMANNNDLANLGNALYNYSAAAKDYFRG
ncbi:MAG: hypothetical protein K5756_00115 [Clostridiales bacterium]|nr:hypothetical protein [Clostridiales bacterium]